MNKELLDTLSLDQLREIVRIKLWGIAWNFRQNHKKPFAEDLIKELKGAYK